MHVYLTMESGGTVLYVLIVFAHGAAYLEASQRTILMLLSHLHIYETSGITPGGTIDVRKLTSALFR